MLDDMRQHATRTAEQRQQRRYLRTPAAAEHIGAAAQTLERWRIEGNGPPFVRLSSKLVVYDVEDLDAWCAARKVTSTSGTR
jgi:predicted DNA-binding transcriptional regulator AlpA